MDEDELFDLLSDIEISAPVSEKAERLETEAHSLPPGEYGRASLLIAAGEHWQMRGEHDRAQAAFELAQSDGGESAVEPVGALLGLALERGDSEAATRHRDALRAMARADQLAFSDYHFIGETYEVNGDLREALRWFTMPFTYADPDDEDLDYLCLVARLRVREALGLSRDRFDHVAAEELAARRAEQGRAE